MLETARLFKHRWVPFLAICLASVPAAAATNQFRGVNWADQRDNFQPGVIYISGLSSTDTYDSAKSTGDAVMSQFVSKLGVNSVRLPVNEATVSKYWSTYAGAIDAVVSKGTVILCYWSAAHGGKPAHNTGRTNGSTQENTK